jgi:hypothetical protein
MVVGFYDFMSILFERFHVLLAVFSLHPLVEVRAHTASPKIAGGALGPKDS